MEHSAVKKPFISGIVEGKIDPRVYQDVLATYAKECITLLDFGNMAITTVDPQTLGRVEFTECEISPFRKGEWECEIPEDPIFSRQASTGHFSKQPIALNTIENFLVNTFSPNADNHRPYPSAGGLYPVEPLVFLFQERVQTDETLASGAYHFRPLSKSLQLIKKIPTDYFFTKLLHGLVDANSHPCFAILYVAHVGKSIFKYRYRGYRQALMEVGSMYQHALVNAQHMGLRSTVWSSFSEQEMLYALDLDHGTYLPLTMQLFGFGGQE